MEPSHDEAEGQEDRTCYSEALMAKWKRWVRQMAASLDLLPASLTSAGYRR